MKKIFFFGIFLFASFFLSFAQDVKSMFEQSQQLFQEEKYVAAVELLDSIKPLLNKNSKDYAIVLNSIGLNYSDMQNYSNAEPNFLEALKVLKKVSKKNYNEYATISNNLGLCYSEIGDYNNAEKYYLEAKTLWGKAYGKEHQNYGTSLNNLGLLYDKMGDNTKAEKYYLEALTIKKKNFGIEHSSYAVSLFNIGSFYNDMGDYAKAEKFYLEAKTIFEKTLGKEHPYYAKSLNNLGDLYSTVADFVKAEEYYLEALSIRKKVLGIAHPDYATVLSNLGSLYRVIGDFVNAEECYLESLSIREKVFGKEDPDYAVSLGNLGHLYCITGNYLQAEKYILAAKTIFEKTLGRKHDSYVTTINNLGYLYSTVGDYAKAEKFYLEAKVICEEIFGKEHLSYATPLNNLGLLYSLMGNYTQAEKYYLDAKNIWEKVLGKEHIIYSTALNNLGLLYNDMGDAGSAEKFYLEALKIEEKGLGKEHPDYARTLSNLGILYKNMGDFAKAEEYYLEALSIREKSLGKEHPDYATSLNNLGNFYLILGDFSKSEQYCMEAKTIWENVFGKSHPAYAISLSNLGLIYYILEDFDKFETLISEAYQIRTAQVEKNFTFLSDKQRECFWEKEKKSFEVSYSFAYAQPTSSIVPLVYNNTLFTKGLMLRTANEIRDVIYTSGNTDLIVNLNQLGTIRQQITALQTKEKSDLSWIKELENRADSLDKALTLASSEYRDFKEDLTVGWSDIQKHLNLNEVAIEFINFELFNKQFTSTDSIMYCAMLVRKDSVTPEFIPLFEQSQLMELLNNENTVTSSSIQKLYNGGNPRFFNGQKLYDLIWKPLEKYLDGIETVYYSPAGLLNRISFAAIPVDSLCLIDIYNLILLSSTREIVHKSKQQKAFLPLLHAVVYGGIKYDVQDETQFIALAEKYKKTEQELFVSRSLPNDTTRSTSWNYLQGTETEANEIETLLQKSEVHVSKYREAEANEESFKNLSGNAPELLHIATHGFFLENEKEIQRNSFLQHVGENNNSRVIRNPLLRSGLLFAGANRAWTNKEVIEGIEDGILTAEEIANLNLTHTKLVVLSACKTGLGDVDNSEGVFGLQRSFKLAGVETLVMSLWDVSDNATCQFMLTFYQNLLDGKTKLESFKTAQKQIREKYKNPYYWAAFIMLD